MLFTLVIIFHFELNLRTYTSTINLAPNDIIPGRLTNAGIALTQMQQFFDQTQITSNIIYSFNNDVLGGKLPRSLGYVTTKFGYADGINWAASALNTLVHRTFYWDANGIQRPLFEEVASSRITNDRSFGDYAVSILFDGGNSKDYKWQLNPGYHGPPPKFAINYVTNSATRISISVTFADEIAPPAFSTEKERFTSLSRTLNTLIADQRIGVTLIDVKSSEVLLNVNDDAQVPIASAWKGAGEIFFFEHVDSAIWRSVPIKYWNSKRITEVPPAYQEAWSKYGEVLHNAYVMTVFSGNHEAANVLSYVFSNLTEMQQRNSNPIRAFNTWSQEIVGISPNSGLYNWLYGNLEKPAVNDPRFVDRRVIYKGKSIFFANTYNAQDLAHFYYHLATVGRQRGYYDAAVELLSIRTPIISKIEAQTLGMTIQTASKDGYFGSGSENSLGYAVNNDAGLLLLPDGREYAVAFTALEAVQLESDVVGLVVRTLAGR